MGRKSKYTPETVAKLTHAIRLGASYEQACGYAGISDESLRVWRTAKPGFLGALKEAEGVAAVGWLAQIEAAANAGIWQAAAWKLERRYPQYYGRRRVEQVETTQQHPEGPRGVQEIVVRHVGADGT